MSALTLFGVFIFGTLVGSFLNVVALRYGFKERPRARSACGACGSTLRWFELLPFVSFFLIRGACLRCGSRISLQYPTVELALGFLFVLTFFISAPLASFEHFILFMGTLVWWSFFVLLVVYDVRHTLVPFYFSIPFILSAIILRVFEVFFVGSWYPLIDGALGALIVGGMLGLLYVVTRGCGMGSGDAYVGIGVGFLFGMSAGFDVILGAFWIGALTALTLLAVGRFITGARYTRSTELPFVPFLFFASVVVFSIDTSIVFFMASIFSGL